MTDQNHKFKTNVHYSLFSFYIGAAPALRRIIVLNTHYQTSDISENLGKYLSSTEHTVLVKDGIDSNGKNGTRHPVEGSFWRCISGSL